MKKEKLLPSQLTIECYCPVQVQQPYYLAQKSRPQRSQSSLQSWLRLDLHLYIVSQTIEQSKYKVRYLSMNIHVCSRCSLSDTPPDPGLRCMRLG